MNPRKLIAVVTMFACGILVGVAVMLVFVYGAIALWRGLPMVYQVWRLQPSARLTLIAVGLSVVGSAAVGGLAGRTYWIRMLRMRGSFDSSEPTQLPTWFLDYARMGVYLAALFGAAFAFAIFIPLGLLYLGEAVDRLFRDLRDARATVAVAAALGALIGFPTGFYWGSALATRLFGKDIVDRIRL